MNTPKSTYSFKARFNKTSASFILALSALTLMMGGCQTPQHSNTQAPSSNSSTQAAESPPSTQPPTASHHEYEERLKKSRVIARAEMVRQALAKGNYSELTPYIHPKKGVRFSMYAYVDPAKDKVFSREQFAKYLIQDRIKFTWGAKDGTGESYITTLPNYLEQWVDAKHFSTHPATLSFNRYQGQGNSLNNLKEAYPNAEFVEIYNAGVNPEYSGMDWRSLRLVFEEYEDKCYLVGIINDMWTI